MQFINQQMETGPTNENRLHCKIIILLIQCSVRDGYFWLKAGISIGYNSDT